MMVCSTRIHFSEAMKYPNTYIIYSYTYRLQLKGVNANPVNNKYNRSKAFEFGLYNL